MRVVLHIGMHKTGTSAFQRRLEAERETLGRIGVVARPLDRAVLPTWPEFDADALVRSLADAAAQGAETVVFSHESLCQQAPPDIARLRELLAPHPVRVVCAFRHWTGFLPSRWRQNCSRRDTQSFSRFLARLADAPARGEVDFAAIPTRWRAGGFEDFVAVSYDAADAAGDVLGALARACGLPFAEAAADATARVNVSRPHQELERLRLFNGARADAEGQARDALFDRDEALRAPIKFFDQGGAVRRALAARPDLGEEIDARLDSRRRQVALRPEDFAEASAALELAVSGAVANAIDGRLFPHPRPVEETVSDLEVSDLPRSLRDEMVSALRRGLEPPPRRTLARRALGRLRRLVVPAGG